MKKLIRRLFKRKRGLLSQKVNFILDERLNNIKLENLAPKKLEEANFNLSKIKSLPK